MKFGSVALAQAQGAVLAHSLHLPGHRLGKGLVLSGQDIRDIGDAGMTHVVVAQLEAGDLDENAAALQIAEALVSKGFRATAPFAGRVNILATEAGLFRLDAAMIGAVNGVNEAITLATLPDHSRVAAGKMVATVKIIPYAVATSLAKTATQAAAGGALRLCCNVVENADLVLTRTELMKPSLLAKAEAVTEGRMRALGVALRKVEIVAHDERAVAKAISGSTADLVLILSASATSDRDDVAPAGLIRAGGRLVRFGMPVDPGNLLFVGAIDERPVVGLPGCARSLALNGADWVLQRLVAGQDVTGEDIANMGVGGLLKEIPLRAQPRAKQPVAGKRVELVLLAAGASRRMRGEDKLLREVEGQPLLRRSAELAKAAEVSAVRVVLPEDNTERLAVLQGLDVTVVETSDWQEGMAASLRAGLAAVSGDAAAVVVALADMPEVTTGHINRLIAAFDPEESREICRAVAADGTPGHPVLFSRRFFESLMDLQGDHGAKDVLVQAQEFVTLVSTPGQGAVIDLDTPEAWAAWAESGKGTLD
ncbi:MAG: NTP transferase domain-containing protein [Rhodobacteraceae bacterium]|nr:NTP transferase domain-containing protein [Paracoccaceae bacterium]